MTSSMRYLLAGVPQGSVLGPLLFTLYVNDSPHILESSNALMYADDTCIIVTANNPGESKRRIKKYCPMVIR